MRPNTALFLTLTFLLSTAGALSSVSAKPGPDPCSSGGDSWTPRPGATFSVSTQVCGFIDPSTGGYSETTHSVSSSRTDASLIPQSGDYYFKDGSVNRLEVKIHLGKLPNNMATYKYSTSKEPGVAITAFENFVVVDKVSGANFTFNTFACVQDNRVCF